MSSVHIARDPHMANKNSDDSGWVELMLKKLWYCVNHPHYSLALCEARSCDK